MGDLKRTPLFDLHVERGGKMVPFAGWEMPVQYPLGVMKEHLHTRAAAGLFDVSHMGQVILRAGPAALEALVPVDVVGLAEGRQRYGVFTNTAGGIMDDLMIANRGDHLFLVVNAAMADQDIAHLRAHLGDAVEVITDRALLALQGPKAEAALARIAPDVAGMRFMDVAVIPSDYGALWVSRSGYTGEDGYEISVGEAQATALAEALLAMEEVEPIGLGARDSLRLEAGLPLYGHDLTAEIDPVTAELTFALSKKRREAGGYHGHARISGALSDGAAQKRVGLVLDGRLPAREGSEIFAGDAQVGTVTSGGFSPTLGHPIAMGYVDAAHAEIGTSLEVQVRNKRLPARVAKMPFVPHRYYRGS